MSTSHASEEGAVAGLQRLPMSTAHRKLLQSKCIDHLPMVHHLPTTLSQPLPGGDPDVSQHAVIQKYYTGEERFIGYCYSFISPFAIEATLEALVEFTRRCRTLRALAASMEAAHAVLRRAVERLHDDLMAHVAGLPLLECSELFRAASAFWAPFQAATLFTATKMLKAFQKNLANNAGTLGEAGSDAVFAPFMAQAQRWWRRVLRLSRQVTRDTASAWLCNDAWRLRTARMHEHRLSRVIAATRRRDGGAAEALRTCFFGPGASWAQVRIELLHPRQHVARSAAVHRNFLRAFFKAKFHPQSPHVRSTCSDAADYYPVFQRLFAVPHGDAAPVLRHVQQLDDNVFAAALRRLKKLGMRQADGGALAELRRTARYSAAQALTSALLDAAAEDNTYTAALQAVLPAVAAAQPAGLKALGCGAFAALPAPCTVPSAPSPSGSNSASAAVAASLCSCASTITAAEETKGCDSETETPGSGTSDTGTSSETGVSYDSYAALHAHKSRTAARHSECESKGVDTPSSALSCAAASTPGTSSSSSSSVRLPGYVAASETLSLPQSNGSSDATSPNQAALRLTPPMEGFSFVRREGGGCEAPSQRSETDDSDAEERGSEDIATRSPCGAAHVWPAATQCHSEESDTSRAVTEPLQLELELLFPLEQLECAHDSAADTAATESFVGGTEPVAAWY